MYQKEERHDLSCLSMSRARAIIYISDRTVRDVATRVSHTAPADSAECMQREVLAMLRVYRVPIVFAIKELCRDIASSRLLMRDDRLGRSGDDT